MSRGSCRYLGRLVLATRLVLLAQVAMAGFASPSIAAETVLSNFNGTGFSYTFDGFLGTAGATSARLYSSPVPDEDPGWGGGGATSVETATRSNSRSNVAGDAHSPRMFQLDI